MDQNGVDDGGDIVDGEAGGGADGALMDAASAADARDAALASGAFQCLSCGGTTVGTFCPWCGQKNDDLRRSSVVLVKDFFQDTFGFDSRMWRTLGLMAAAPGLVPANYAHGRRSRYTPPVRLFLVVSFLFFLTLALTQTLFIALEVTPKTAEQIAADQARLEKLRANPDYQIDFGKGALAEVDGTELDCNINFAVRYFVRARDVKIDEAAWRACAESIRAAAAFGADSKDSEEALSEEDAARAAAGLDRAMAGLTQAVENPRAFNSDVNAWLPRVMFFMTPVLALLLAMFIRGRDALLFDHLVLSLYSHAVSFVILMAAIFAAQAGFRFSAVWAMGAIGVYFFVAVKRAYRRGWIKTLVTSLAVSLLYLLILVAAVSVLVGNAIWGAL